MPANPIAQQYRPLIERTRLPARFQAFFRFTASLFSLIIEQLHQKF
jgi:hypothetical protein